VLVPALDGHFGGPPLGDVAIDKPRRGVELLGDAEFGRGSLPTAHDRSDSVGKEVLPLRPATIRAGPVTGPHPESP